MVTFQLKLGGASENIEVVNFNKIGCIKRPNVLELALFTL